MAACASRVLSSVVGTGIASHGPTCPCGTASVGSAGKTAVPSFNGLRQERQLAAFAQRSPVSKKMTKKAGLMVEAAAAAATGIYVDNQQKTVKKAAPAALATIAANFPNAMEHESFIRACARELQNLGFTQDNCIAIVNTCRDEVCRPLVSFIDKEFGHSFNISGLGGLITCGKTGLKAGMSHSPEHPCDSDGKLRERYVFFAFPHISIGESGMEGSLLRRGRGKPSSACGALIAVKNSVTKDSNLDDDSYPADDFEFAALKRKVVAKPACQDAGDNGPSLIAVTKAALEVITEDLEDLIAKTVDPSMADYAVITGVQIHSGNQIPGEAFRIERTVDYIAPIRMYAVIRGEKVIMHPEVAQIVSITSVRADDVKAETLGAW